MTPSVAASLRDLRERSGADLTTVAARMGVSAAAAKAIETQRLGSSSVSTLVLYAAGLDARVELVFADGRRLGVQAAGFCSKHFACDALPQPVTRVEIIREQGELAE